MTYVAARGGEAAIERSEQLYRALNGRLDRSTVRVIEEQLPYLVDRVMGEGSLYAPDLAALAIAQTGGDLYEAVLLLRAYRSTQPRLAYAVPICLDELHTVRRISAAFKDIPGGQILGPSLDYSHRILHLNVLDGEETSPPPPLHRVEKDASRSERGDVPGPAYPAVAGWQRLSGLLDPLPDRPLVEPAGLPDVTREPISYPAPREHRLQTLSRADTGGILALGYSTMRGYGLTHPTVNELRLGFGEVRLRHRITGVVFSAGRVRLSHAEVVTPFAGGETKLGLGFAATLGWNEVKILAASMLDLEMENGSTHPAHVEEFVLEHTEPVEASGFCIHYKLPHYVTFNSSLDSIRAARKTDDDQPAKSAATANASVDAATLGVVP
jgi:alpha-D-ribose 1-methylphosphonate 5-triphosphate synthase subunit PhnI